MRSHISPPRNLSHHFFWSRSRQCRTLFFIQNSIHKYRYDRRAEDKNFPVFDFTSSYFLVSQHSAQNLYAFDAKRRKQKKEKIKIDNTFFCLSSSFVCWADPKCKFSMLLLFPPAKEEEIGYGVSIKTPLRENITFICNKDSCLFSC